MGDYIKKNIANLKPSATLAINEKIKQLLKDGKKVFNFGFGQSPFPIPEKIVSVLRDNAHKKDYLNVSHVLLYLIPYVLLDLPFEYIHVIKGFLERFRQS